MFLRLEGEKSQGDPSDMSPTGADKQEQIDRLNELVSQLKVYQILFLFMKHVNVVTFEYQS